MNYSYFTLGFVCLIAIQVNGDAIKDNAGIRETCFKKVGLSKREITTSLSGLEFLKHPLAPVYLECFFEEKNLFNPDGSLNPEEAIANIDPELRGAASPIVVKCKAETYHIVSRSEKAHAAVKCMAEKAASIFSLLGVLEFAEKA